jgi:hypothetical protein
MKRLARVFRRLDTSEADAAIAQAADAQRAVQVRARALRMDIGCGDAGSAVRLSQRVAHIAGDKLREMFGPPAEQPIPADMQEMVSRIT